MSVICKTFVQNTWRRDLCSNCFKSKEEHGGGGGGGGGLIGGGGGVGGGSVDLGLGEEEEDFSLEGVRPGSKRYVGVAGRVYQRGYYAQNSWKSLVIDKSDPSTPSGATRPTSSVSLMSPALIRGVASSLVTQENEKNRKLSDLDTPDLFGSDRLTRRLSSTLTTTGTAAPTTPATVPPPRQSQAKILSQLLDDKEEVEERREEGKKSVDKEEFEKGDASSDLGSEASNDSVVSSASSPSSPSSTSSVASSSTCQVSYSAPNSDTASIKSEGKEEEEEEESKIQTIIVPPKSILRKTSSPKKTKRSKEGRRGVTFNSQLQELIGYGGDVDYGDDEEEGYQDEDDEDDDDEDFFEDLASLTPHERMLRRETMKNTEYNSDNKNLSKDIPEDEILPSVQELEEKRKLILAEIEALERLGRENKLRNEKVKEVVKEAVQEDTTKQEARVKLKRSSPLVSTKPLIARTSSSEPRVNQVLPMKNGEVVRPGVTAPVAAPLIDAPPKYVSLEEEMVEKEIPLQERPDEVKNTHKVTSIDDVYEIKEKVTCLDDVCRPKKDASPSPPPSGSATEPPAVPRPTTAPPARPAPPSKAPAVRSASECGKAVTKDQAVKENKGIEKKSASPPLPSTSPPTTTTITTTTPASTPSSTSTSTTVTTSSTNTSSTTTTKPSTATTTTTSTTTTTPTKAPHPVSAPRKSLTNGTAKKEPVLRRTSTTTSTTTTTTTSMTEKVVKKEDSPSVTVKSDASPASSHMESQAKESRVSQSESGVPSVCESPRLVTQSSLESTKAPASRQSSTSSCMSTFGTPIMLPTTTSSSSTPPQQNTSFLHSSRGAYEDPYSCPANLVAPATPDFLREIKTPPEVPTPTAGISKSALYASTSCLKGLPGARPVITPKPPMLKEKPRVPLKPPPATRGIYATPAPVTPKVPITGLSGAVSTPNLASMGDSALSLVPKQTHPPVAHAFSTPVRKEAVYDIPVTLPPTTTTTTTTSSTTSPTPTTITQNKPPTDDTIYHEITDTLTSTTTTTTTTTSSPSNIQRHESARCQTRSTFEANRSLLSAALDFNSRANLARRSAPTPAEDDEEDQGHPEEPEGTTQTLQDVQKDRESASSFTDDFDDDDEEEFGEERKREEIHQALPAITTTTATSSSSPFRNSIGPIVTHETQGVCVFGKSNQPSFIEIWVYLDSV
ncbi:hypothetical protein E2C01_018448 [Portunus trituberculatus]|uniref:Uncharacterized protein n=1 Tax=Portunus trituberculatus TaxID=210409 RepID=A0A5B7DUI2_PORTR|nr:hypothetical protein [Portunus trituberculatus]